MTVHRSLLKSIEVIGVEKSLISVIIPTYNRAAQLSEAVESVLDQDYLKNKEQVSRFELLVVDDGSTDNTREIVSSFGDSLSYIYSEHRGVSATRNLGLLQARGEYVAFLDSDDLWKKDKLSIQMNYMKTFPHAVMCYTEETWIRNGRFVNPRHKHRKYSGMVFDKVLPLCLLSLSSALFRRGVFEEIGVFDEDLPACEDYDLGIRLAHKYPWHLISKPLILKRGGHSDQLSRQFHSMDVFRIRALEKALSLDLASEQKKQVYREIVIKSRVLVAGLKKRNKHEEMLYYQSLIDKYDY